MDLFEGLLPQLRGRELYWSEFEMITHSLDVALGCSGRWCPHVHPTGAAVAVALVCPVRRALAMPGTAHRATLMSISRCAYPGPGPQKISVIALMITLKGRLVSVACSPSLSSVFEQPGLRRSAGCRSAARCATQGCARGLYTTTGTLPQRRSAPSWWAIDYPVIEIIRWNKLPDYCRTLIASSSIPGNASSGFQRQANQHILVELSREFVREGFLVGPFTRLSR